jgi:hypothetical protein
MSSRQYSIYNETLDSLNPDAQAWSTAAFDEVEKHASIQSFHISFINSLSTEEKKDILINLNLPDNFFDDAMRELSQQLVDSEAECLTGIRAVCHNTSLLLATGGDDRLTLAINKGKVNKYNGSTFTRHGIISRGSCTCSTITEEVVIIYYSDISY